MLREYEQRIKSDETSLGALAVTESDCSSARKRGDLYVSSLSPVTAFLTHFSIEVSLSEEICKRSLRKRPLRCSLGR